MRATGAVGSRYVVALDRNLKVRSTVEEVVDLLVSVAARNKHRWCTKLVEALREQGQA